MSKKEIRSKYALHTTAASRAKRMKANIDFFARTRFNGV